MATAFREPERELSFKERISEVRDKIISEFKWLHQQVKARMDTLLSQLSKFESEYDQDARKQQTGLDSILRIQQQVSEELKENYFKSLQDTILDNIKLQLNQMKVTAKKNTVLFEFNHKEIIDYIANIGRIRPVSNYKDRKFPVTVSEAKHGNNTKPDEFYVPSVLAIHPNSGNIFIGNCNYSGPVMVFNSKAVFIYYFDTGSRGHSIGGIAFNGDSIYVSFNGRLKLYTLRGKLIKEETLIKNYGGKRAITILNNTLYITCGDKGSPFCKFNITNQGLKLIKFSCAPLISKLTTHDIKPTPEGNLAVLYNTTPFVIVYSTQGDLVSKPLDKSRHLKTPEYFAIDSQCNFIISDDFIKIFESNGSLLHTIGGPSDPQLISFALGIDIDSNGRIINICGKQTNCLQIF